MTIMSTKNNIEENKKYMEINTRSNIMNCHQLNSNKSIQKVSFGSRVPYQYCSEKTLATGKNLLKNIKTHFQTKKLPLSKDILVVKNNVIKDNTKDVLSKVSKGPTSYNTKNILEKNPNSLSSVQKKTIQQDLDYQLKNGRITQHDYEKAKRQLTFTGNEHEKNVENADKLHENLSNNIDISNSPESPVSFDDVSTIDLDTPMSQLTESMSSLDVGSLVDSATTITSHIDATSPEVLDNVAQNVTDSVTDNSEIHMNIIKKMFDIFSNT